MVNLRNPFHFHCGLNGASCMKCMNPFSPPTRTRLFLVTGTLLFIIMVNIGVLCSSTFLTAGSIILSLLTLGIFFIPVFVTSPWSNIYDNQDTRHNALMAFMVLLVLLVLTAVIWGSVVMSKSGFRDAIELYCEASDYNCVDYDAAELESLLHQMLGVMLGLSALVSVWLIRESGTLGGESLAHAFGHWAHVTGDEAIYLEQQACNSDFIAVILPPIVCTIICFSLFFPLACFFIAAPIGLCLAFPFYMGVGAFESSPFLLLVCYVLAVLVALTPSSVALAYSYMWLCEDTYATYWIDHPTWNTTEIIQLTTGHDSLSQGWINANCIMTDVGIVLLQILAYMSD